MATSTASPGTIESSNAVGTVAWVNPSNAASSNDSWATAAISVSAGSEYLVATNLTWDTPIPAGSTINTLTVSIERGLLLGGAASVRDDVLKLVVGGAVSGNDKTSDTPGNWAEADTVASYAFTPAEWGVALTAAVLNAADFGAAFSAVLVKSGGGTSYARIDHVYFTADFTPPAVTFIPHGCIC